MINGSSINSFAINGAGGPPTFSEGLTEVLNLNDILSSARLLSLFDSLTISGSSLDDVIFGLSEAISLDGSLSSSAVVNNIIDSDISVDDIVKISLTLLLAEDISLNHSQVVTSILLNGVADILSIDDSITNQISALSTLALNIVVSDLLFHAFPENILEELTVNQVSLDLLEALSSLVEQITVSLSSNNILVLSGNILDDLSIDDISSFNQILFESLFEDIVMVLHGQPGDTYSGWVLNPETFAIWNYDNYNFNSMTTLEGTTFLANNTGLFTMEGSLDDTAFIQSRLKTAALSFGTSNLKQVPDMYLGMSLSGEMVIGVTTDERVNVKYKLVLPSTVQEMQTVKLGKGLRGSLWQFELIDDKATSLDISSIEWVPIIFGRKRR